MYHEWKKSFPPSMPTWISLVEGWTKVLWPELIIHPTYFSPYEIPAYTPLPFSPLDTFFFFFQPLHDSCSLHFSLPFLSYITHTIHYSSTRFRILLLCFLSFRFTLCLPLLHSKRIPCVNHAQIQLLPINQLLQLLHWNDVHLARLNHPLMLRQYHHRWKRTIRLVGYFLRHMIIKNTQPTTVYIIIQGAVWRAPGHCEIPDILGKAYLLQPLTQQDPPKELKKKSEPAPPARVCILLSLL